MPLTCAQCGTPYSEGMLFCSRCGGRLQCPPGEGAAQQPVAAQPAYAPGAGYPPAGTPPGAPHAYGTTPPHRLPGTAILALVIGAVAVIGALGLLTTHHGSSATLPISIVATPTPTAAPATPSVTTQGTGTPNATGTVLVHETAQPTSAHGLTALPTAVNTPALAQPTSATGQPTSALAQPASASPSSTSSLAQPTSAAASPTSALAQPTATYAEEQPTAAPVATQANAGQTVSTNTFSIQLPSGWQVAQQSSNEMLLTDTQTQPNSMDIGHDQSSSAQSAEGILQSILTNLQQRYPDAAQCTDASQGTVAGVTGTHIKICYTFTPQGGAAFPAVSYAWAATDASGESVYMLQATAASSNTTFWNRASDLVSYLQWND